MRLITSVAALATLVALSGCGSDAAAGENWIFYSYEESTADGKSKHKVQEGVNIKYVSQTTFYPIELSQDKEKQALLWMLCSGKEIKIYGPQAETIWKQIQKNN